MATPNANKRLKVGAIGCVALAALIIYGRFRLPADGKELLQTVLLGQQTQMLLWGASIAALILAGIGFLGLSSVHHRAGQRLAGSMNGAAGLFLFLAALGLGGAMAATVLKSELLAMALPVSMAGYGLAALFGGIGLLSGRGAENPGLVRALAGVVLLVAGLAQGWLLVGGLLAADWMTLGGLAVLGTWSNFPMSQPLWLWVAPIGLAVGFLAAGITQMLSRRNRMVTAPAPTPA